MIGRGRDRGTVPYWAIVASLALFGILSLPSIGWFLIALALFLALLGGIRTERAIVSPTSAGLLALIVAYVLFAPGLCVGGAAGGGGGSEESCTSLAYVPLGGENWLPFLVLGPLLLIGAVLHVHRSRSSGWRSSERGNPVP